MFFDDTSEDYIQALEEISQLEVVAFEGAPCATLDDRQTRARQDSRRRTIENAIDFSRLREVSDLGCAAEVGDRRQQVILHDRAQRDVRAELLRLTRGHF